MSPTPDSPGGKQMTTEEMAQEFRRKLQRAHDRLGDALDDFKDSIFVRAGAINVNLFDKWYFGGGSYSPRG